MHGAADKGVAILQGAVLDEHGAQRAAALVQLGLHDVPARGLGRVGLELQHLGLEHDHFEQLVQADALLGRDIGEDGGAAPFFRHEVELGQLALHAVGVGAFLVDLVHRDHDGHACGLGVVHGFAGLVHHAVVSGDHEHHDVRHLCATGAHGGEGFVARGVEEHDLAPSGGHMVRADVLGDAARLARGDAGHADGVEERGLAVVDVAHDGDHRRPGLQVLNGVRGAGRQELLLVKGDVFHLMPELAGQQGGGVHVQRLVDGGHDAHGEQGLDDGLGLDAHLVRQVGQTDVLIDADLALADGLDLLALLHAATVLLAATRRLEAHGRFAVLGHNGRRGEVGLFLCGCASGLAAIFFAAAARGEFHHAMRLSAGAVFAFLGRNHRRDASSAGRAAGRTLLAVAAAGRAAGRTLLAVAAAGRTAGRTLVAAGCGRTLTRRTTAVAAATRAVGLGPYAAGMRGIGACAAVMTGGEFGTPGCGLRRRDAAGLGPGDDAHLGRGRNDDLTLGLALALSVLIQLFVRAGLGGLGLGRCVGRGLGLRGR